MVAAQSTSKEMRQYNIDAMQPQANKPLSLRTMHGFPVERRPQLRELSKVGKAEIDTWFSASESTIGAMTHNRECVNAAKMLLSHRLISWVANLLGIAWHTSPNQCLGIASICSLQQPNLLHK